jgi:hypothetical protein
MLSKKNWEQNSHLPVDQQRSTKKKLEIAECKSLKRIESQLIWSSKSYVIIYRVKRKKIDQKKCLLVTEMKVFAAGANPTFTRYNRFVTVLAKLLQTKHNKVFFHVAHLFSKLGNNKKSMY